MAATIPVAVQCRDCRQPWTLTATVESRGELGDVFTVAVDTAAVERAIKVHAVQHRRG